MAFQTYFNEYHFPNVNILRVQIVQKHHNIHNLLVKANHDDILTGDDIRLSYRPPLLALERNLNLPAWSSRFQEDQTTADPALGFSGQ